MPGGAVGLGAEIGAGMAQMLRKEQCQLLRRLWNVQGSHPGVRVPCGKQRRLPADQGGKAPQRIHQPVTEYIRPGSYQEVNIIFLPKSQGVLLGYLFRLDIVQTRQRRPLGAFVQTDAPQAVQNPSVGSQQVEVAGAAHQLRHQPLLHREAHFVGAVEGEHGAALHLRLGDVRKPGAQKVLAQQHTEHGGLRRVFRGGGGQMQPGGGGVGHKQQLFPALLAAKMEDQGIPAGLMELVHPGPQTPGAHLLQNRGEKKSVKCHELFLSELTVYAAKLGSPSGGAAEG